MMIFKIILIKLAILCYLKSIKTIPAPNNSLNFDDFNTVKRYENFNQTDGKMSDIEKVKIKYFLG